MDPLRSTLDKLHPTFSGDGKLARLYPVYEALDTFLYTPGETTTGGTHVRDAIDLKRLMITVVVALIPCIAMACWNTGYQANSAVAGTLPWASPIAGEEAGLHGWQGDLYETLGFTPGVSSLIGNTVLGFLYWFPIFLVCNVAGGLCEVAFSIVRKHEVNEGFLVTGMLFPLTCGPVVPLWQVAVGIIFSVVLAKEAFGGTGKNFLNIALTARAFLYFAYPSDWSGTTAWTAADGVSAATPLTIMNGTNFTGMEEVTAAGYTWMNCFLGTIPGSLGSTSLLAVLIGAAILIVSGVANWRIMLSGLIGVFVGGWFLNLVGSEDNLFFGISPVWHLAIGAVAFGLVFMATDPVSSTMTMTGHWWYGGIVGLLTVFIRVLNPGYPEGIMLAILFGNVFAPVIDYFVVQRNVKRRRLRLTRDTTPAAAAA